MISTAGGEGAGGEGGEGGGALRGVVVGQHRSESFEEGWIVLVVGVVGRGLLDTDLDAAPVGAAWSQGSGVGRERGDKLVFVQEGIPSVLDSLRHFLHPSSRSYRADS